MRTLIHWQPKKLDELGDIGRGKSRHRPRDEASLFGGPYPFIQTGDVKAADLYLSNYTQTYSEKGLAQSKLWKPGTLCITIAANIAETAILKISACFPDSIVGFVPFPELADVKFVKFYIDTIKLNLQNASKGTTQDNLSLDKLLTFNILTPPLLIQRKIAAILSAYDDLIENNTRRIAILEEVAQSLYREWFVHFRFPGHEKNTMVESPLGMIPQGWEVKPLKYFGMIITGKTPSTLVREYFDMKYMPFIKTPDMHGNMFCVHTEDYLSEQGVLSQKNKTIPPNSLCVNCIGALAGSVSITATYAQTNQQINSIVLSELTSREFLYFILLGLKETIHLHGSNGATMVNLNKGKFESLEIVCPKHHVLMKFHEITYAMFEEIKMLLQKNANLRRTRDHLLPKLISGELDVEELDIEVGDDGGDASDVEATPVVESEEATLRQDRFNWNAGDVVFS